MMDGRYMEDGYGGSLNYKGTVVLAYNKVHPTMLFRLSNLASIPYLVYVGTLMVSA